MDPHRDLGTSSAVFFFFGIFQGAMLSRLTAEEEKAERLAPLLPRRQVPHAANLVSSPAPKSSDALRAKTRRRRREGNREGAVGVFDFLEVGGDLGFVPSSHSASVTCR